MTRSTDEYRDCASNWLANMHFPMTNDFSAQGWSNINEVSSGVAGIPSAFHDGTTPKAQHSSNEPNWAQYGLSNGNTSGEWNLHTGMTPNGDDRWGAQAFANGVADSVQQEESKHEQQHRQNVGPMPIPARSQTEPLWQRRLKAKNKELHELHAHVSASSVTEARSVPSPESMEQETLYGGQESNEWSQPSTLGVIDHDFTHASPNTLRMLGIDPSTLAQTAALPAVNGSSVASSASPEMDIDNHATAGVRPVDGADFAAQMALMQTLNAGPTPEQYANYSSSLPQPATMINPDFHRRSLQEGDAKSAANLDRASAAYMHNAYRSSSSFDAGSVNNSTAYLSSFASTTGNAATNTRVSSNDSPIGKGVIGKVIVPPAHGAQSDAIDLRTGEEGQMRHMCPHSGCDKHFSTSGHARRHSRIHDCLRPFECPHEGCHATFTRRDNCTQHQRARHRYQLVAHRIGDE